MARNPGETFEVPPEMRAFAERSFEQARQAFDGFLAAANRTVSTFEGQAQTAQRGAKDIGQKAMSFAEKNIANAFDFAQQLVRAKDVDEILKMQADYIKSQMQALSEQAKELGESTSRAVKDSARH
jgi:phasin